MTPTPPQSRDRQPSNMTEQSDHQGFILQSRVEHLKVQSIQKPKNEKRTLSQQIQRVDTRPLLLTPQLVWRTLDESRHFPPRPDQDRNDLALPVFSVVLGG